MGRVKKMSISEFFADGTTNSDHTISTSFNHHNHETPGPHDIDDIFLGSRYRYEKKTDVSENDVSGKKWFGSFNGDSKAVFDGRKGGHRPRLNLSRRTVERPTASVSNDNVDLTSNITPYTNDNEKNCFFLASGVDSVSNSSSIVSNTVTSPKPNPYGFATAVDTATRLRKFELKARKKKVDFVMKNNESPHLSIKNVDKFKQINSMSPQILSEGLDMNKDNAIEVAVNDDFKENLLNNNGLKDAKHDSNIYDNAESKSMECRNIGKERRSRRRREPRIVNSRAALLGETSVMQKDKELKKTSNLLDRNQTPLTIVNERVAKLAEEEKKFQQRHRIERYTRDRYRYLQNHDLLDNYEKKALLSVGICSRFSKTVTEGKPYISCNNCSDKEKGQQSNLFKTRFTAAIEADKNVNNIVVKNLGPPPVHQNSRFAIAAQAIEEDRAQEIKSENNCRSRSDTNNIMKGQGSRFNGLKRSEEKENFKGNCGKFFVDNNRGNDRRPSEGGRYSRVSRDELGREVRNRQSYSSRSSEFFEENNKTLLIAPTLPDHLQPKKKPLPKYPPVEAPLALPGEDEVAARARIERRKKDKAEKLVAKKIAKEKENERKFLEETNIKQEIIKAAELEGDLLMTFGSGEILGKELAQWCSDQGPLLPSIDKLILSVLDRKHDSEPDSECKWADPSNFGNAILSLVEGNTSRQVQVLRGVQKYCYMQDFPKINGEYLVQAMFRSIYKFNLADLEAFYKWKDDESEEHSQGKTKTIIQTVGWFNWLEEEEDKEEDYDENDDLNDSVNYFDDEQDMYL